MLKFVAALAACLVSSFSLAQDATAVLRKASATMGEEQLNTLRYSGSGTGASFGQAYQPGVAWPKLNIPNYVRQIDYQAGAIHEDVMRGRAEPKGGGAVPIAGEGRAVTVASGKLAWNVAGPLATPRQQGLESRLHDLWTTPHGVIKAASRGNAKVSFVTQGGKEHAAVSFAVPGVLSATAFFNEEYILERVESRYSDNVMGDIPVVTTYSEYRIFGPIVFPTRIQQTMAGFPTLDIAVKEVQPNAKVDIAVPEIVAKAAGENVTTEKAADGVWFVAGGSHNSAAIEMKDHVILVESPLNDARALAVFAAVRKAIPGKPIRYVVNSHSHFDHSGGLRAAVGEGLSVITHANNKAYYEKAFAAPSRVNPDHLAKSGRKAKVMPVAGGKPLVLGDGARRVEIRAYSTDHVDGFLLVYLPQEKLLIQADGFTPGPPNSPPPSPPNNYGQLKLVEAIEQMKLQVDRHLPLHGRIVPNAELYRAAGKPML
jgi:glyoxylase-like metal-dependent hydrolase (beta-lactamase superfamily II)